MNDQAVAKLIAAEEDRQARCIPLIASENFCSADVQEALGSVFVNKYAEGRPGARYYAGNEIADQIERLAEERALALFDADPAAWSVNVQPLSGTPANLAVYAGLLKPGDRILSMNLAAGGHLSHGHPITLPGQLYEIHDYGVDAKSERLDYDAIARLAQQVKPKLIIAGASAYPREIDFAAFGQIARSVDAYLMADISHIAGLVAAGLHPSPIPHADIVTTTTHKTLRGPRSALIICRKELASQINRGVFPGVQGGPHLNQIAAVAVALGEAAQPEFKKYARAVIANAQTMAETLTAAGWRLISGGTDNHLLLADLTPFNITGRDAQTKLEAVGLIANANAIPFDTRSPRDPAGLRLGTAAVTTLGATNAWCQRCAELIDQVVREKITPAAAKSQVRALRASLKG